MAKTTVQDTQISFIKVNEEDHVSLTDMLKARDGDFKALVHSSDKVLSEILHSELVKPENEIH